MKHTIRPTLLTAMVLMLVIGCAGQKEYESGIDLMQKQQFEQALPYLEKAVTADPGKEKYTEALADVKDKLIRQYVTEGEDILTAASPMTDKGLQTAETFQAKAQALDSSHHMIERFSIRIASERKDLLTQLEGIYQQAYQNMRARKWEGAFDAFSEIQTRYTSYKNTDELLTEVKATGSEAYYKQALVTFQSRKFDDTIKLLWKALKLEPGYIPARELLQRAENAELKQQYLEKAQTSVRSRDWDTALDLYEQASALDPDDQQLQMQMTKLRQNVKDLYERTIQTELGSGLLLKALEDYKKAEKFFHGDTAMYLELMRTIKMTADSLKKKGNVGAAWFWYDQAVKMNASDFESDFAMQELEEQLLARAQKSLAIFDFKSPQTIEGAGVRITGELISYLSQNLTPDVRILERENLKTLVDEMALSQSGMVSEETTKKVGQLFGVDMAVMGSISLFNVDSSITRSQNTAAYNKQVTVPNPNYDPNWRQKVGQPNNAMGAIVYGMSAAILQPDRPMIEETRTFYTPYTVEHHKKVVNISISYRIVDIETGLFMKTKMIKETGQYRDDTHQGVPQGNIWADPLNIPSDVEILQMHSEKVMKKLGPDIVSTLQHLEQKYFKEGENYQRRRQILLAAEKFVDAIFDERLKNSETHVTKDARTMLQQLFLNYRFR
ncbi:MAG: tetratricopeptide repeat protein [Deltaproteobacteria bacterium]|nr:tetratricopeptide repeat protein [Deltaproteobacteria bacterium]